MVKAETLWRLCQESYGAAELQTLRDQVGHQKKYIIKYLLVDSDALNCAGFIHKKAWV